MATLKERFQAFLNPRPVSVEEPAEVVMRRRYQSLCEVRDRINAEVKPQQDYLDKANAKVAAAQAEAKAFSDKINEIRGGEEWLQLKKEIGLLARALSGK